MKAEVGQPRILVLSDDAISREISTGKGSEAEELVMLHRSGESRFIFQRAGRRTMTAGADLLTIVHLLEEILDHLPSEARHFFAGSIRSTKGY